MASNTSRLNLLKKDPIVDGNDTFNIKTMLNDNWDKLDQSVALIDPETGKLVPGQENTPDVSGLATKEELDEHKQDLASQDAGKGASLIGVQDADGLFTSTTVEGALKEAITTANLAKTQANEGKTAIASAVDAKGVPASPSDTFPTLATKIGQISSEISGEIVMEAIASESIDKGNRVAFSSARFANVPISADPSASAQAIDITSDNTYLAIGLYVSPFLEIYKNINNSWTKIASPTVLPTSMVRGLAFSSDGVYLAVATDFSPFITIYKRSGDAFTKLADPSVLFDGNGYAVSFSPDGQYLSVGGSGSTRVFVYKRSGDTFTKLANPSTLPTGTVLGITFSSDYMVTGGYGIPYLNFYKREGDTFTKLSNPPTIADRASGVDFTPDGMFLAVSCTDNIRAYVYKRDGDTFSKMNFSGGYPTSSANAIAISDNGIHVAVAWGGSPYINLYKRLNNIYTKQLNASGNIPSQQALSIAISSDARYMATADQGSVRLRIYESTKSLNNSDKYLSDNTDVDWYGYAKESATTGQNVQVAKLWEV